MDFNLTEENKMVQKVAREFRERVLDPTAEEVDVSQEFPLEIIKKIAAARLMGMTLPTKYGGGDSGEVNFVLALEQLGHSGSPARQIIASNNGVGNLIAKFGSEELKEKYLPQLCSGEAISSLGFTEPATGSDTTIMSTRAVPDGDDYVINGMKRFCSNSGHKGPVALMCKDEEDGVTCFIVDKHCEGFTVSSPYNIMGFRGQDVRDVYLKDVRVPKSNMLGKKGKALKLLLTVSANERLVISAFMLGLAQECLNESIKYSQERTVKEQPIATMGQIQYLIAEMASKLEAARWFIYRTAFQVEKGAGIMEYQSETAKLKVFVGNVVNEIADMAMQVHGAYSYTTDFKIERLYRTAKFIDLVIGSKEVMRSIASNTITGIF